MGSFSWTRAEHTTKRSNLTTGDKYKILVPKEFGGGYIKDIYYDYGYIFASDNDYKKNYDCGYYSGNGSFYSASYFRGFGKDEVFYDLYGLLAWWNKEDKKLTLDYDGFGEPITTLGFLIFGKTSFQDNRCKGIDIGCYDRQIDRLKYPLKLVSASYKGTYEDCKGRSYGDPNQGFSKFYWTEGYDYILKALKNAEEN
jgi:hypothetical protein